MKSLEGKALFFSLDYQERHYTTCEVGHSFEMLSKGPKHSVKMPKSFSFKSFS